MFTHYAKKALIGAFFLLHFSAVAATSPCLLAPDAEKATVQQVTDGDTFKLSDGRKIRLLAVGTTEINWKNRSRSDPLALEARKQLQYLLPKGTVVSLASDQEAQDKYQRRLAQVVNAKGQDVGAELIKQGMAYTYIFPPNERLWPCYRKLEQQARQAKRGLWALASFSGHQASTAPENESGYQLIHGRVSKVKEGKNSLTLTLDDRIKVFVRELDSGAFHGMALPKTGDQITVRDYLGWRETGGQMDVRHPQGFDR